MVEKAKNSALSDSQTALSNHISAPKPADFTKEDELHAYRQMFLARRFEEKTGQLYGEGKIGGFCHLYIGQEAVVVGVIMAKKKGDQLITSYREHALALTVGCSPRSVMAELMGREDGVSKGKGGSMHMFSREHDFYGGNGIVGAQVPLGTGFAFANKYRDNGNVSVSFFGDGASNQGQVYESFNMASLWKLPIVYIIENNHYGMGTSVNRASAETDLSRRGISFEIPGMTVDGMDVRAVKSAMDEAFAWARSGKGPILLSIETYRYRGHSMSDPVKYRTREEVDEVRRNHDPIEQAKKRILAQKMADEKELDAIEQDVVSVVADAINFAENDPQPAVEELYTDIVI